MDMRKGWNGAMRRVVEVANIVAGTEKQIPRFARDDSQKKNARDDNSTKEILEAAGEAARRTVPCLPF